jgi:hypothetical protein
MGFLSSVFGGEKELPRLDAQSVTARRIEQNRAPLETFAAKVKDRLELVPTSDVTYFFIGKPPGTFGIAWIDRDGEEHNLKTMMQKQGLSQQTVVTISEALRTAYENHQGEPRYHATLAGKTVTVIPSDGLAAQVQHIVHGVS